jgi:hypothetical protein
MFLDVFPIQSSGSGFILCGFWSVLYPALDADPESQKASFMRKYLLLLIPFLNFSVLFFKIERSKKKIWRRICISIAKSIRTGSAFRMPGPTLSLSNREGRVQPTPRKITSIRIFKLLRSPRIDSNVRLCSLYGPVRQPYSYSVPSPQQWQERHAPKTVGQCRKFL